MSVLSRRLLVGVLAVPPALALPNFKSGIVCLHGHRSPPLSFCVPPYQEGKKGALCLGEQEAHMSTRSALRNSSITQVSLLQWQLQATPLCTCTSLSVKKAEGWQLHSLRETLTAAGSLKHFGNCWSSCTKMEFLQQPGRNKITSSVQ